jgi:hypothetical protein
MKYAVWAVGESGRKKVTQKAVTYIFSLPLYRLDRYGQHRFYNWGIR